MDRTACVVVTYNRKEELLKNLTSAFSQTEPPEFIFVVDNYGKDGAKEFLTKHGVPTERTEFLYPETNIGGAGGVELGLSEAVGRGFEWVILMDDDGRAKNQDCFARLFSQVKAQGLTAEDKVFFNALVSVDGETLSFGLGRTERVSQLPKKEFLNGLVNPFNGTLVSVGLTKKIGFPNGKFFIKGDEVDYELRAKRAGAIVGTVRSAEYYHPAPSGKRKGKLFGREFYLYSEAPWKEYYAVRNYTYSLLQSGEKGAKRKARLFYYKRLYSARKLSENYFAAKRMIKLGYRHGKKGILGGTVSP